MKKRRCAEARKLWLAWHKENDEEEKRLALIRYQLHLRTCEACRVWWEELKRMARENKMPGG